MLRTIAFRFAGTYALIFSLLVAAILGITYVIATAEIENISRQEILYDMAALRSAFTEGGLAELAHAVHERSEGAPGDNFYLLAQGERFLGGNIPVSVWQDGWQEMRLPAEVVDGDQNLKDAAGMNSDNEVRLFSLGEEMGPYRVMAGRNSHILHETKEIVLGFLLAGSLAIAFAALATGYALSRAPARRLERILDLTRLVTSGALDRRLPLSARGDEIDRLSAHINAMLDRIERLMQSLRQVSTDIAHDLRTPLARLRQRLEGLREGPIAPDALDAALDQALVEADTIIDTFNALLRIAQVEAGARRARFRSVSLSALSERLIDLYREVAVDAGHRVDERIEPGIIVEGDPDLLTQLLANLIENAITHMPPPGHIALTLTRDGAEGLLVIADSGPGIPEPEHAMVFRRLYRLDRSRSTPGSGLGLAMVAAIAELHDATIRLGDAGPGLIISIRFPIVEAHTAGGRIADAVDHGDLGEAGQRDRHGGLARENG